MFGPPRVFRELPSFKENKKRGQTNKKKKGMRARRGMLAF
jgi:hypothetical protein